MSSRDHRMLVVLAALVTVLASHGQSVAAHGGGGHGEAGHGAAPAGADGKAPHVPGQPYSVDEMWDTQVLQNTEHIQEDLEEFFNMKKEDLANMTAKELEYYYFELHDFDKNRMLDGLELLKAVVHIVEHGQGTAGPSRTEDYATAIDMVLDVDDTDNDGYLSYAEFVITMKKHEEEKKASENHNQKDEH